MIHNMREAGSLLHSSGLRQMGRIVDVEPSSLKEILETIGDVHVEIPDFVSALKDICRETIGYGFAVFDGANDEPVVGGDGYAIREAFIPFTPDTRLNIHSMSKTVTAAAITHALHLNPAVTLSDPIGPFLRPKWDIPEDSDVRKITFEDLLVHDTGLGDVAGDVDERSLAGIRQSLERGIDPPFGQPRGLRTYQNVNYSLCRILLPHIDIYSPLSRKHMDDSDDATFDHETIEYFIGYIKEHFFDPLGVPRDIQPHPAGAGPFTRYYNFLLPSESIPDLSDSALDERVGASSWFMSAAEYGKFIAGLRYRKIFGRAGEDWSPWDTMTDFDRRRKPSDEKSARHRLGMKEEDVGLAKGVVALGKAGGGSGTYGPTTGWIAFSNVTAVLMINSRGGHIYSHLQPDDKPDLEAIDALRLAIRAALKGI